MAPEALLHRPGPQALARTEYSTVMLAKTESAQQVNALEAYGCMELDSVYLDIKDLDGLAKEVDDAVAVGFEAGSSMPFS